MNYKNLGQMYAEDEARSKAFVEDLREKLSDAEKRINEIVTTLRKETGMIIEIETASGIYHAGEYGDRILGAYSVGFQKAREHQRVYQVVARMTA